ncbi:MAG: OmpA family protein [Bacteroidota bacterium]|jgi:OOP family OmpA-OmpF porin|nr:OmpA family protein [Bacteroidota bacterium]MCA6443045.1 OmpA family protein [Bacteroidota bacterium]
MRFLQFIITIIIATVATKAQTAAKAVIEKNLIPNGSFENYRKKSGSIRNAIPWKEIASVDFYQKPLDNDTTLDKGASEGYCYAGIRFQKRYKEYLQVKLVESLHRGTVYEFSMKVKLAFWSNAVLKSMGVLFTKAGYTKQADAAKANMIDSLNKKSGIFKAHQWFTIHGFYKADGGEKFITIGNFAPKVKQDMMRMNLFKLGFKESYYFIDDVKLVKFKGTEEQVEVEIVGPNLRDRSTDSVFVVKNDIKVGDKITLNNIFFENGKYYLLPESYQELNKLANYLIKNPNLIIQINGHSDNSGLKYKNLKISELRAREVFEYLITKGVQNKLLFKGFGSSMPVASNDTDDGKAKNRRVEFEIIKN